jgi:hypothetical protein
VSIVDAFLSTKTAKTAKRIWRAALAADFPFQMIW